jgi:hypothetical protein
MPEALVATHPPRLFARKKKLFIFELVVNLMIISDKNELMMKTKYLENSYESGSWPVV